MGLIKSGNKILKYSNKILNNFKYKILFIFNKTISSNNLKISSLSNDNNYLAFNNDSDIKIYQTSDWSELTGLTQANGYLEDISFSKDNNYIAGASQDYNVYVYEVGNDWSYLTGLTESTNVSYCVDFSNNYIAYGSRDNKVYIHNIGGNWNKETELTEAGYFVYSLDFSNNDNYIAYSTYNYVYIHDVGGSWNKITGLTSINTGGAINSVKFSNNNNYLAFTDPNNEIINIYQTNDWTKVTGLTINNSNVVDFSPDDEFLIIGTISTSNLFIYNTNDWSIHQTIQNNSNQESITSNDNNLIFTTSSVNIYDKERKIIGN